MELFEIQADGWAKVIHPDGRHVNIVINRLTFPIPQIEVIDLLDYPEKPTKLTIEIDKGNGVIIEKILQGEDVIKWNLWMRELCMKASDFGMNPKWLSLNWEISEKRG